jgi:hypothetical protein
MSVCNKCHVVRAVWLEGQALRLFASRCFTNEAVEYSEGDPFRTAVNLSVVVQTL